MAPPATTTSSSDASAASKPGTACLCCRRRKLKCTREISGCENCRKADLPCIYPTADTGVKKKRGPYRKKDKPARQAHLDHVVKYLSDPIAHAEAIRNRNRSRSGSTTPEASFGLDTDVSEYLHARNPEQASADLVKDAISALAKTSVVDRAAYASSDEEDEAEVQAGRAPVPEELPDPSLPFVHPGARQMMELWHIFTVRVDPATKIIHCATFQPTFCEFIGQSMPGPAQTLVCAIYYSAIATCTDSECLSRFKQTKPIIQRYFKQAIEIAISSNHGSMAIEFVQALVLYLTCICRGEVGADIWAIYALTVRSAQVLKLDEEPGKEHDWYEGEIRRRLWWTICSLEARCAEEGARRRDALFASIKVKLPLNINDNDLQPGVTEMPQAREGITSMSFVLVRWEIMRLMARIQIIRKQHESLGEAANVDEMKRLQRTEFDKTLKDLDRIYLRKCHKSRAYDWVVIAMTEVMMIKCRLVIDFPDSVVLGTPMSPEQRLQVLRFSVMVVRNTYYIMNDPKAAPFLWFFRSYLQWHSMAIVVSEIANSEDPEFVSTAWQAVVPFIKIWHRVYQDNSQQNTWKHVNMLIERAQLNVRKLEAQPAHPAPTMQKIHTATSCSGGILPFTISDAPYSMQMPVQPLQPFDGPYTSGMEYPSILSDSMDYASTTEATGSDMITDPSLEGIDMNQPFNIDYGALQTVFGSSNWDDAFNRENAFDYNGA